MPMRAMYLHNYALSREKCVVIAHGGETGITSTFSSYNCRPLLLLPPTEISTHSVRARVSILLLSRRRPQIASASVCLRNGRHCIARQEMTLPYPRQMPVRACESDTLYYLSPTSPIMSSARAMPSLSLSQLASSIYASYRSLFDSI